MAKLVIPRVFNHKYNFLLMVDGLGWAGFSKVGELKAVVGEVKHREGGGLLPFKAAGLADFPDLPLERGAVTEDIDLYTWMTEVVAAPANLGLKEVIYKRNADLFQLDRDGEILKRYTIFEAFPKEFVAGEWDNSADEVVIEKVVLCYKYFVRTV